MEMFIWSSEQDNNTDWRRTLAETYNMVKQIQQGFYNFV